MSTTPSDGGKNLTHQKFLEGKLEKALPDFIQNTLTATMPTTSEDSNSAKLSSMLNSTISTKRMTLTVKFAEQIMKKKYQTTNTHYMPSQTPNPSSTELSPTTFPPITQQTTSQLPTFS